MRVAEPRQGSLTRPLSASAGADIPFNVYAALLNEGRIGGRAWETQTQTTCLRQPEVRGGTTPPKCCQK